MELNKTFTIYYMVQFGTTAQIVECKARYTGTRLGGPEYMLTEDNAYLGHAGAMFSENEQCNKDKSVVLAYGIRQLRKALNRMLSDLEKLNHTMQAFQKQISGEAPCSTG